jgi:hypothetical protein
MAKVAASAHIIREYHTDAIEGEITDLTGEAATPAQVRSWLATGCLGRQAYEHCPCTTCADWQRQLAEQKAWEAQEAAWESMPCEECNSPNWACHCYCEGCQRTGQSRCKC